MREEWLEQKFPYDKAAQEEEATRINNTSADELYRLNIEYFSAAYSLDTSA